MKKVLTVATLFGMLTTLYAGVSSISSNGNISGVPSWQVTCSSGSTHIIYKKNGTWYHGSLGHMGHRYDSWTREEVANYVCNNL